MRSLSIVVLSLAASSLAAQSIPYTVSPASGPKSGGTIVTLRGSFDAGPHRVFFGGVEVDLPHGRPDAETLTVKAPAHFANTVEISIYEGTRNLSAGLTYTYTGEAPLEQFDRVLLPVFVPAVRGAFGSEFRTTLHAAMVPGASLPVFGAQPACAPVMCIGWTETTPVLFEAGSIPRLTENGTPGRFLYVRKPYGSLLSLTLRAADITRSAQTLGTEIPVARERDFAEAMIVLPGVPMDARYRNTLRIYAPYETSVWVNIEGSSGSASVPLTKRNPADPFEPAYAEFSDFPTDGITRRVVVIAASVRGPSPPIYLGPIWAFISVTNNETQMITTITP
jgi:hypothetical protein